MGIVAETSNNGDIMRDGIIQVLTDAENIDFVEISYGGDLETPQIERYR